MKFPSYLAVPAHDLGKGTRVKVRVLGDMMSLGRDLASDIKAEIIGVNQSGRGGNFIVPVGPVDQYPLLAQMLNEERISCRNVVFIGMDEYLDEQDMWLAEDHPLSFRGYLNRMFYDRLDKAVAPPPENRVFPDPRDPGAVPELIARRGGVDACYGGIGITGHIAFNEPPPSDAPMTVEAFAALPTRVLTLTCETRTINSVTVGGEIAIIPRRAVTVGMKEILGARRLRLYCNRPWQSSVVRRVLHGPITAACPASLMRTHADATLTVADYVAAPPNIQLR
ncbi:MAG TPA: glucosamine-6-phosphate isomerase [Verrucomicrobiae bacterium]